MVVTGWETVEALASAKSIIECQLFNNHIVIRMKKLGIAHVPVRNCE